MNKERDFRIVNEILTTKLKNEKHPGFGFLANYVNFNIYNKSNRTIIEFWCDKIDKKSDNNVTVYRRSDEIEFHSASIIFSDHKRLPKMLEAVCYECLQKLIDKLNLTNEDYQFLCKIDNPKIYKEFIRPNKEINTKNE